MVLNHRGALSEGLGPKFSGLGKRLGGLGFDVSGVPDLAIDGETGRLARPADGKDLGDKLCQMAADVEATAAQGARAKQIASNLYVASREADDYQKLYAALLADDD